MTNSKPKSDDYCSHIRNDKYVTDNLTDEDLLKYKDQEYKDAEVKMNEFILCQASEQRCRPFFCRLQNCLGGNGDADRCLRLFRLTNNCVEKERKKIVFNFIETGKQLNH